MSTQIDLIFFFLLIYLLFIYYLFLAVLGLRFCVRAFSSCGKRGPLFIVMCGPLTIAASLVAEHRLQTRRLSCCGSRAQLLCGMWDLLRPGLEHVSPALAGRFSTTAPPGKPNLIFLIAAQSPSVQLYRHLFKHFSTGRHLGGFQFFVIINNTAVSMHIQAFLCICLITFL